MSRKKDQHIVPADGGWGIRGEGNSRLTGVFETQQEAYDRGREIAKNNESDLYLHGRNGRIRAAESYGSDPESIRDKEH